MSPDPPILQWKPVVATEPVGDDPDDPAIWIHPSDPAQSLIVVTSKSAVPSGALVVYDLEGKIRQTITGLNRPNNVDIRQSVSVAEGANPIDIVVATERFRNSIRLYRIETERRTLIELPPIGGLKVFEGEQGEAAQPMGIGLYRRPSDAAIFAIVGRKSGPSQGYLWQYLLKREKNGQVSSKLVRKFGSYSGQLEIESIAVDDALGFVYYSDETAGIRKYHADPDHPDASRELAFFGRTGYKGDHEGIAIYQTGSREGYLVSTDQIERGSRYFVYRREGTMDDPHDHTEVLAIIEGAADITDGIEATSKPLGSRFPNGMLAVMNSGSGTSGNFLFYAWPDGLLLGPP